MRPARKSLLVASLSAILVVGCARAASAPTSPGACAPHTFPLAGACVSEEDARAYCGKVAEPSGGGCTPRSCPEGDPLDLASGECVPRLKLKKLAAAHNPDHVDDAVLGCAKEDAVLTVEGSNVTCVPRKTQCGRGARWVTDGCRPDPTCPSGSVLDAAGACAFVVHRESGENVLDVGRWVRAVVGPDGGEGTSAVCGPFVARPWALGVVAHGNAVLEVEVELVFPDNDVSRARVAVNARRQFDPRSQGPDSLSVVTEQLDPVWKALRSLGGVASAASATTEVHCAVDGGTSTLAVPRSKDGSASTDSGKTAS